MPAGKLKSGKLRFSIKDVSKSVAETFKANFRARKKIIDQYFTATRFADLFAGNILVKVFDGPPTSEALLPAWEGRPGEMIFPARRARDGKGAIVHELGHVHAPNQVRFLTEGYSIYLEEMLGNIDAVPTLGVSIEAGIRKEGDSALAAVDLLRFDAVSTQRNHQLGDNVALEGVINDLQRRRTYAYLIAGSCVKYLVNVHGLYKFKCLYELSPLTPGVATAADPDRYRAIYGKSVKDLEAEWRIWLANQ
jgi:hypothetical protein